MGRGNIDFDQLRDSVRKGEGAQFQMFGGGATPVSAPLLYDAHGSAIAGTVQGNGTKVQMAAGEAAHGHVPTYDEVGNLVDAGVGEAGQILASDGAKSTWVPFPGLMNPMTSAGDMIVGGASGAPTRLAAGASGLVLTASGAGATPSWRASSGGGGGIDLSSIPIGIPTTLPSAGNMQIFFASGGNLENQVPVMYGNTSPSGVASASESYSSTPPWGAFNDSTDQHGWITNGDALPQWIRYQFVQPINISAYAITPWSIDNFPSRSPTQWVLQGSNDGSTWVDLDTQTFSNWILNQPSEDFVIQSPQSYLIYRLYIIENGGNTYTGIRRLQLKNTIAASLCIRDYNGYTRIV